MVEQFLYLTMLLLQAELSMLIEEGIVKLICKKTRDNDRNMMTQKFDWKYSLQTFQKDAATKI